MRHSLIWSELRHQSWSFYCFAYPKALQDLGFSEASTRTMANLAAKQAVPWVAA